MIKDERRKSIVIGKDDIEPINKSYDNIVVDKCVCAIKSKKSGGIIGSGFIVEGGYLMTNYHVFSKQKVTAKMLKAFMSRHSVIFNDVRNDNNIIEFDFDLNAEAILASYIDALDYVRVKVKAVDCSRQNNLSDFGHIKLQNNKPKINELVSIIQFPDGGFKSICKPDAIIHKKDQYLYYLSDTKPGASGSPVFNKDWKIVALHHAGRNLENNIFPGYLIDGKVVEANRGILIDKIIKDIKLQQIKNIIRELFNSSLKRLKKVKYVGFFKNGN